MKVRLLSLGAVWIGIAVALAETPKSPEATPEPSPQESAKPTPTLSRRQLVDSLSDEDVEKAIKAIEASFLDGSVAGESALRRAALEGLLVRMGAGLGLSQSGNEKAQSAPFPYLSEILDAHIGYVRPGTLDAAALSQFDSSLKSFQEKGVDALILDLRGVSGTGDFENAAEFARRLSPRGKLLFTLQKPSAKQERIFTSNQDPVFTGQIVVLTDSKTAGAAEALAATLRANTAAMVIGADTAGAALEFQTVALGPTTLKVAVGQVLLPQGGALFPGGVKPDIAISLPSDVQEQIFRESTEKGVSQFVFEVEKRRMNEASLVANTNPEIDGVQQSQKGRQPTMPKDTVLQRAVDLVTAIQFYSKKQGTP
jgi:hypothetical protein